MKFTKQWVSHVQSQALNVRKTCGLHKAGLIQSFTVISKYMHIIMSGGGVATGRDLSSCLL